MGVKKCFTLYCKLNHHCIFVFFIFLLSGPDYSAQNITEDRSTENASLAPVPAQEIVLESRQSVHHCSKRYSCANCFTTRVCSTAHNGSWKELTRTECKGEKKFCDLETGTCTAKFNEECLNMIENEDNIPCSNPGFMEHRSSCLKYYYCHNNIAYLYSCPAEHSYDSLSQSCKPTYECPGCSFEDMQKMMENGCFIFNNTTTTTTDNPIQQTEAEVSILEEENVCRQRYSCYDCNTVRICTQGHDGKMKEVAKKKCSSEKPYCNAKTGTCQTELVNLECAAVTQDFPCPADGFYPHFTDCNKYIVCHKGFAHLFSCPARFNYDPASQKCRFHFGCHSFNCKSEHGVKVRHPIDFSYFGYCSEGEIIFIDKCPSKYGLNDVSQLCEPTCDLPDIYPDLDDCRKFYMCSSDTLSSNLKLTHHKCAKGYVFDPINLHCIQDLVGKAEYCARSMIANYDNIAQ